MATEVIYSYVSEFRTVTSARGPSIGAHSPYGRLSAKE